MQIGDIQIVNAFHFRFVKNRQVIYFEIPEYSELGAKNVWPLVKQNQELLCYFPDYKPSQLPEKEYMYAILSTLMPEAVRKLVAESLKKRSPASQDDKDGLVEMIPELQQQITQLYSMKSK